MLSRMRKLLLPLLLVALLLGSLFVDTCQARGRLRIFRRSVFRVTIPHSGGSFSYGDAKTDQERAQAEADFMAANHTRRHIGGLVGTFEGIGWGAEDCPTCVPGRRLRGLFRWRSVVSINMTLVADAVALSSDGMYYRVRGWR